MEVAAAFPSMLLCFTHHCYHTAQHMHSSLDLGPGPEPDGTRLLAATPGRTRGIFRVSESAARPRCWRTAGAGPGPDGEARYVFITLANNTDTLNTLDTMPPRTF